MWFPANDSFKGQNIKAPKANAEGSPWFVDDTQTNSFRTLRIDNSTATMIYTEFDPTYEFRSRGSIQFFELYDLDRDPWSLTNIYGAATEGQKADLHARISKYFACSGASCP